MRPIRSPHFTLPAQVPLSGAEHAREVPLADTDTAAAAGHTSQPVVDPHASLQTIPLMFRQQHQHPQTQWAQPVVARQSSFFPLAQHVSGFGTPAAAPSRFVLSCSANQSHRVLAPPAQHFAPMHAPMVPAKPASSSVAPAIWSLSSCGLKALAKPPQQGLISPPKSQPPPASIKPTLFYRSLGASKALFQLVNSRPQEGTASHFVLPLPRLNQCFTVKPNPRLQFDIVVGERPIGVLVVGPEDLQSAECCAAFLERCKTLSRLDRSVYILYVAGASMTSIREIFSADGLEVGLLPPVLHCHSASFAIIALELLAQMSAVKREPPSVDVPPAEQTVPAAAVSS